MYRTMAHLLCVGTFIAIQRNVNLLSCTWGSSFDRWENLLRSSLDVTVGKTYFDLWETRSQPTDVTLDCYVIVM